MHSVIVGVFGGVREGTKFDDTKKRKDICDIIFVKTIQQRVKKIKLKYLIILKTKRFLAGLVSFFPESAMQ